MAELINLKEQTETKLVSPHPWEKTIKHAYKNKIKTAHNSVWNPSYPVKKVPIPDKDCIKFTVIGDRITKEFIYCSNIVKGLHKYRKKKFAAPTIRGVTTIEWPEIWRKLKIQYGGLAHCLQSQVAVLMNDKILGGEKELKEFLDSKYVYHLTLDYYNEAIENFATFIRSSNRPCAYMHISIDDEHIGTLIFMLYADIVPNTSENFLHLCNVRKGGYSGTPIHRIVKDGWIQGGGYGLKKTDLECENFIIPHDRRGVLCMANDGRHVDCSTQFFVLLQPAPWMTKKYVAFGQLIEGASTLDKIEKVPTWYESPTSKIIIHRAGIFNMECQDITINKRTHEYIFGHIEDLNALGDILIENLLERVFLEIEMKIDQNMDKEIPEEVELEEFEGEAANIHATQRFMRKKEEIEKQIQSALSQDSEKENNDFDVEEYELEESCYHAQTLATSSVAVKPERPFYIPLTNVPYPGDVDSTYNLKKFLKGDYCLESDLGKGIGFGLTPLENARNVVESRHYEEAEIESNTSLDSEKEMEIRRYFETNADTVSFAGNTIKRIAKGCGNVKKPGSTDGGRISPDISYHANENKKVSISIAAGLKDKPSKINRRQTGFVRPEDLEKIHIFAKSASDLSIDEPLDNGDGVSANDSDMLSVRSYTCDDRRSSERFSDIDIHVERPSVMQRLYKNVTYRDSTGPTLRDYRPIVEALNNNMTLITSPYTTLRSDDSNRERFHRRSITVDKTSFENVLNMQHNKKVTRKISSDYVKTIDQMEHRFENSIRSIEYAKTRPSITVSAYQLKNMKYQEELKRKMQENEAQTPKKGLRLPGDTPLYSFTSDVTAKGNLIK